MSDPATTNAGESTTAATGSTAAAQGSTKEQAAATPSATSSKDSEDAMNLVKMIVTLFILGTIGRFYGDAAHFGISHITGFHGFFRFLNIGAHSDALCSCWPQNMVVTFAILNGVSSNGRTAGHWAGDIINVVFSTFGGLIMNDILNVTAVSDFAFWAYLPVTVVCWYFVNHNIPMTNYNLWTTLTQNKVMDFVPLGRVMNLCTLAFNCSLLFAVAAQHPLSTFWHLPVAAKGMAFCVAVHCSGNFFGANGFNFSFSGCSGAANRACLVYFWIATHGLSSLGTSLMAGDSNGLDKITVEGFGHLFGASTTEFCWSMIVLAELLQDFTFMSDIAPYMPHTFVQKHLNKFFFGSSGGAAATGGSGGAAAATGGNAAIAALEARVAQLEAGAGGAGGSSIWDNLETPILITICGAFGFFFGDANTFGFSHMGSLDTFFHGSFRFLSTDANTTVLHAVHWPQNILVTLAIWNGVKNRGNGGYWVNNIILSVFSIFGGLIMNDILNATPVNDYAFWSYLPVTIVMWYLVNYNIPKTSINVFGRIESFVSEFLPLQRMMDLCTLSFNCSLLFTVAGQHEAETFWCMPQVAKGIFFCVAVHCANDFVGPNGFNISFNSCSATANRAVMVYVWTATKGLSTIGVAAGATNGFEGVTSLFGSVFGEGAQFLWAMILLGELFGDQIPWKPHQILQSKLNNFFKP